MEITKETIKSNLKKLEAEIDIVNKEIKNTELEERIYNINRTRNALENKIKNQKTKNNPCRKDLVLDILFVIIHTVFAVTSILFGTYLPIQIIFGGLCASGSIIASLILVHDIKKINENKLTLKQYEKDLENFNKKPQVVDYEKSKKLLELEIKRDNLQTKYIELKREYDNLLKQIKKEKKSEQINIEKNTKTKPAEKEKIL